MTGMRRAQLCSIVLIGQLAFGCATYPGGHASFTAVSKRNYSAGDGAETVAHVDESRCTHNVLFIFAWGDSEDHEIIIADALRKHQGDALTNAELSFTSIPAILYNQTCARVVGDVVKLARADASATSPSEITDEGVAP